MIVLFFLILLIYIASFLWLKEKVLPFYKNKKIKTLFFNYQPLILKQYINIYGNNFHHIQELEEKRNILKSKGFSDAELFLLNDNLISLMEKSGDQKTVNEFLKLNPHCFWLLKTPTIENFKAAIHKKPDIILFWKEYFSFIKNEEIINKAISIEPVILLSIQNPTIDNLIIAIRKNPSFHTYAKIVSNPDPETTLKNLENKKKLLSQIN